MSVLDKLTYPLRAGAVNFKRGALLRSASIMALKTLDTRRLPENLAEIRPIDRPEISFVPSDSMVAEAIYWFGIQGYEGLMSDLWPRLCAVSENILEIGANIGIYGVIGGLVAKGKYTVVEPIPEIAEILKLNLERNGLSRRVDVIQAAAIPGNEMQWVAMDIPSEGKATPVGAHLSYATEIEARSTEKTIKVPGQPITALVDGCDLIKIDAEGIEESLLSTVRAYLLEHKPTLVIEVLPEAKNLAAFISQFAQEADMQISVVPAYGTQPITRIPADQFSASTPKRFNSKDIVISRNPIA